MAAILTVLAVALLFPGCQSAQNAEVQNAEVQNAEDIQWPREFKEGDNKVVVFQPQIDEWKENYSVLKARAAVAVTTKGAENPVYGSIGMSAKTKADFDSREVLLSGRKILTVHFPNATVDEGRQLEAITRKALPAAKQLTISLDFLMAHIERAKDHAKMIEVNLDPPPIFYSDKPAILVMFMGDPVLQDVKGTNLMFVTNTNWDVLLDKSTTRYFLRDGAGWMTTSDLVKGPWTVAAATPADLRKLPADKNWEEVRKHIPGVKPNVVPRVFSVTRPSELILTVGKAAFVPVPNTKLMYAQNTDSDLFLLLGENKYYFLTSGRWFRAAALTGPWTAATRDLPAEFRKIPADHEKGEVLANVPGTPEAEEAMIMASVPRTVTVDLSKAKVEVVYEGDPKFVLITGTSVQFAENSPQDVFLVDKTYYCCFQAIWFAAPRPTGPWVVCTEVPQAIYGIPATHPKHNVTYVYIYSSTPTTVVVGYTSGYVGCYPSYGVVMFGMGLWVAHHNYHHYHHSPHYYGYGGHAHYNHYNGTYYRGGSVYGPYGGAGRGAQYNPRTGTYSRGAYAYGPSGSRYAREAYNPRTGTYARQSGGSGPYGSWNNTVVRNGNEWARGGTRSDGQRTVGAFETSRGAKGVGGSGPQGSGGIVKTRSGDVYAGKDGQIYKKNGDSWQKRGSNGWSDVQRSGATTGAGRTGTQETGRTNPTGSARPSTTTTNRSKPATSSTQGGLSRDSSARSRGNSNSSRYRSSSSGRYNRSSGGRSGGGRSGGRRR